MKSYPSTSITRLSGDILADASNEPVMITRSRKPGYVIMTADRYESLVRSGSGDVFSSALTGEGEILTEARGRDVDPDLTTLRLFADRLIDREEAETRTGLYLSEILILMGRLGINRRDVGMYEGMSEDQKRLFDKVFSA